MNLLEDTIKLVKESPMTRQEIADLCGVDKEWLNKFVQGRIKNPGVIFVQRVYNMLH